MRSILRPAHRWAAISLAAAAVLGVSTTAVATSANAPARLSPKARRLAKELGVDVTRLRGSGPDGEIAVAPMGFPTN